MTLYETSGFLRYSNDNEEYRCVVEIDQQLSDYYRTLMPKWLNAQRPRWGAHVTVVRPGKEEPKHLSFWRKHEGKQVTLFYNSKIQQGKIYWWLDFYSVELEEIRKELGLYYISRDFNCPPGFRKVFHMTIGNCKS